VIENSNEIAAAVETLASVPQVPGVPGNLDAVAVIGVMIPIVAIVLGIGIGMLALWLDYRKKREFFELHHKERMAAIEKGMEVPALPAEFFQDNRRRARTPGDYLRRGLIWLLVGIAITIALFQRAGGNGLWGLVPAAVGLAYLLFYFIGGRRGDGAESSDKDKDRNNH
jgi:hypothetical protein